MKRKAYDGYTSFQYLEPGVDYREFELAKQIGRVPSRRVEVSDAQEQRVQRLLEETLVVSLHDHVHVAPADLSLVHEYRQQGREWTGYEGLSVSGLDAVFDAFTGGTATITSAAGWKWDDVIFDIGMRLSDIAHQDMLVRAGTIAEIQEAKRSGKVAFIPSLEAATMIENEIDRLDVLYGFGLRCSGIVYSESNVLGSGLRDRGDGGLTDLGRQAVRRMNKLGIAVRPRYLLRRSRWYARRLRQAVLGCSGAWRSRVPKDRVRRRNREPRGVFPKHRSLVRHPRLFGRGYSEGDRWQRYARAGHRLAPLTSSYQRPRWTTASYDRRFRGRREVSPVGVAL